MKKWKWITLIAILAVCLGAYMVWNDSIISKPKPVQTEEVILTVQKTGYPTNEAPRVQNVTVFGKRIVPGSLENSQVDAYRQSAVTTHQEQRGSQYYYLNKPGDSLNPSIKANTLERYEDGALVWSVKVSTDRAFEIREIAETEGGVLVSGGASHLYDSQSTYSAVIKINDAGVVLWEQPLMTELSRIPRTILCTADNGDHIVFWFGGYEGQYFARIAPDGTLLSQEQVAVQLSGGIETECPDIAYLPEGFALQLPSACAEERGRVTLLDPMGRTVNTFGYSSETDYFYIKDIYYWEDCIWLSAYTVPKAAGQDEQLHANAYERSVLISSVSDWDPYVPREITAEAKQMYHAVLLACDPVTGDVLALYIVPESIGDVILAGEDGSLLWQTRRIVSMYYTAGSGILYSAEYLTTQYRVGTDGPEETEVTDYVHIAFG